MANELIRMKSGLIKNIEKNQTTGQSPVGIQAGTIYFAVDDNKETGKILYDVDSTHRVVMSTQAEYADYAGEAAKATGISGIYPVKGTQTATTANWTGVILGVNELFDGLTIAYYLPRTSASNVTLTLTFENGDVTPAVPVYYTGTSRMTTHFGAGSTIILTYWSAGSIKVNGTATTEARWTRADYDSTNIFQLRKNYNGFKPSTNLYDYQILLTKNETDLLPINVVDGSTATNKTLTTDSFDPFGQIYWWNSTSTVNANTVIGNWTSLMTQVLADLRYSFNIGSTLTAHKAVYLVAVPQTNGAAKLDSTPIKQTLPTTKDDKIYIYLGQAYSSYQVELMPFHPIYYYKNGKIALYTGEPIATASNSGLMGIDDKIKLDTIEEGAQVNTVTGVKGNSESTYRTGNINITKANIGLGNVENKSSATIRGELTSANVTTALGYTPATQDLATADRHGLMDKNDKAIIDQLTVYSISGTSPINASTTNGVATISHANSGVTANTYGATATTAINPAFGGTFSVPGFKVNETGHITLAGAHNVKIPATLASPTANGLMSAEDKGNFDSGITIAGNTIGIGSSLTADTLRTSLGLSNAMHFIGHATVTITDNSTTDPEILNYDFGVNGANAKPGDVIIDKDAAYEYVWSTLGRWEKLGTDSYGLSISGHTVSIVPGGSTLSVTVPDNNTWQANTSSQNGYVTSGSGQANKVWKTDANGNPAWRDDANNTYSLATNTNLGLVKPWYNHTAASTGPTAGSNNTAITVNTISTTGGRYYAVESDSNGRLFVNVPWTDNNTWQANNATQAGYVASPNSAANKVWKTDANGVPSWRDDANNTYTAGTGLTLASGVFKAKLKNETALTSDSSAATQTANRIYPIVPDKSGYLSVVVPWTDSNTWNKVSTSQDGYITKLPGNTTQFLRGDGTWATPPDENTTYSSYAGSSAGLVPARASGNTTTKYLREDGSWVTPPDNNTWQANTVTQNGYVTAPTTSNANKVWKTDANGAPGWRNDENNTYSLATYNNLGLVKPAYTSTGAATLTTAAASNTSTPTIAARTTTAGKYYGVEADKNGILFVNVPWTDNNTWQANTSTQNGYVTSGSGQANKVWKTDAEGNPAWRNDDNTTYTTATSSTLGLVKLVSDTKQTVAAQSVTTTANRTYAVQLNNSNQMVVNVPWANDNTDTKVSQTLASDNANYPVIFGNTATTSTTATLTEAAKRNNSIFINPSTKRLTADQIGVTTSVHMEYNSTTKSLDFIFA